MNKFDRSSRHRTKRPPKWSAPKTDRPPKNSPSSIPEPSLTSDKELPLNVAEIKPGRATEQHGLEFLKQEMKQKTLLGTRELPQSTEPKIFSTAGGGGEVSVESCYSGIAPSDLLNASAAPCNVDKQIAPLQEGQKTPTQEAIDQAIESCPTCPLPSQSHMGEVKPGNDLKNVLMSS